ncbi:unnamed protein product, partial [Didymodactylos carnosus]
MDLIDKWIQSFAFRALLLHITSEISGYETPTSNLDSHIECSLSRLAVDITDLQLILSKLKPQIYSTSQAIKLELYLLVKQFIVVSSMIFVLKIEDKIDFGKVLQLTDSDKYTCSTTTSKKEKSSTHNHSESFIRQIFLIARP